jgi:maspardin
MSNACLQQADAPWHLNDRLRRVDISGAEWSYVDTGGSEKAVLLLPGSLGTCEVFFKQIAALGAQYRVVAATYPGIESSAALADGLAGLQQALGLNGALIVGSSFSAYWLQFFALRHPERVSRLVLGNGFVRGEPLKEHRLFSPELILNETPQALQRAWYARLAAGPDGELRNLQLDMLSGRQSADVLKSRLASVISAETCPRLSISDDRIVILDCVDDPVITPKMQTELYMRYPGATRFTLRWGGHYPHVLNPQEYNSVLRWCLQDESCAVSGP